MAFVLGELIGAALTLFIIAPFVIFIFVALYSKPDKNQDGLSG